MYQLCPPLLLHPSNLVSGEKMSSEGLRGQFLYSLPPAVIFDFCRAMDALADSDWTRFASEVLGNMTEVRLADRREQRTDWVVRHLENRNERVGYLVDVLERLQLLRQRDIILRASSLSPHRIPAPPPGVMSPLLIPQIQPQQQPGAPPTLRTIQLSTTVDEGGGGGVGLPPPAPPPSCLLSGVCQQAHLTEHTHTQHDNNVTSQSAAVTACGGALMCWTFEEVHAGTEGFSAARQVGEGGFGVVYRASVRGVDCAVKRLKEDGELDWSTLEKSFQTEVENLSRFRHQNIVDLLGFSVGGRSLCLIYSYMSNRSLEDQLHNETAVLSWSQRISIVMGASAALQFLHHPPGGQLSLIHGDVKSSNILLDRHMVAKLSDFGLARFRPRGPSGGLTTQTGTIGKTQTVRGTLAYLPDEYLRKGELGTTLDVFSFGVVLLEVLTGRRAVEKDPPAGYRYLKDLVEELEENRSGSSPESSQELLKQLDQRLMAGGTAHPPGCLQVAELACKSLKKVWKKRPKMTTVFENLEDIQRLVEEPRSASSRCQLSPPGPPTQLPPSQDSGLEALVQQMSRLGPREDTFPSQLSFSSSSSFSSFTSPHPLHSSSSLHPTSSSRPPSSSSSFMGPCETDESRGFSQYFLSVGTNGGSLRPSSRPWSGPTEDRDHFNTGRILPGGRTPPPSLRVEPAGPDPGEAGVLSETPRGPLQYTPPGCSEGTRSSEDLRRPQESNELDFLPTKCD